MFAKQSNRHSSIFLKLLLPMLLIALAEMAVLFLTLTAGGAFTTLQTSALDALDERTENKQQPLQQEMYTRWSIMEQTADTMAQQIEWSLAANNASAADIAGDPALNARIIESIAPYTLSSFRKIQATGMMVILGGQGVAGQPDSYAGIYLRDTDPSTDSSDNRDLLLLRGLPPLAEQLNTPLSQGWRAAFSLEEDNPLHDYFFKPYSAALTGKKHPAEYYGVWCGPFRMQAEDPGLVLTYTMPLLSRSGDVLGVMGIELSQSYLSNRFNSGEFIRSVPGCYVLGILKDDRVKVAAASGPMYRQHFRLDSAELAIDSWLDRNSFTMTGTSTGARIFGSMTNMAFYPTTSLFSADQWVLLGLQSEDVLLAPSHRFLTLMVVAGIVALLVCLCVAIITSRGITRPISRMVHQVRDGSGNARELRLDRTEIVEIDQLGDSILRLSRDVHESAERLSTILRLTGMAVGVFEIKFDQETAWCSTGFFQLLECEEDAIGGEFLSKARLYQIMREKLQHQIDTDVWQLHSRTGQCKYVRRVQLQHRYDLLGAVMDVTSEIEDRLRIEHERDYDILTGLLNRRAFARITQDLFIRQREKLRTAAVVMMDLDNLKYVNDAYGHDCGDNYIRAFGEALSVFEKYGKCVKGRRSGDEFYLLLYGFDDQATCIDALSRGWQCVMQQGIQLPDGQFYRFRCSAGVSWYPQDARDIDTLIHYADFAMYKVKQGSKGVVEFFDRSVYTEDAFLINGREALNLLIDKHLIHYAFQPIVDARTGDIFGYELLMRPDTPELRSPAATLRLAKAQGLLHHIERLTWYEGLETVRRMRDRGLLDPKARIFLNSIANQVLDQEEQELVLENYGDLLSTVTLEVTESEENNMAYTDRKLNFVRDHGGLVAIDDYGTGYNSEMALMRIDADFVKVDISFVRDVDSNPDRQQLVRNLISYARRKNMLVLGEGVETRAEMETLISFGIDYVQGYYLGRPANEPQGIPERLREEIRQAASNPTPPPIYFETNANER